MLAAAGSKVRSDLDTRLSNQLGLRLGAALVLGAFYFLSAPQNHGTALDSYGFAYWISDLPISAAPELRLFLWIAALQLVYDAVSLFVTDPDPFVVLGLLNALQTAAAVVLLERILSRRFR